MFCLLESLCIKTEILEKIQSFIKWRDRFKFKWTLMSYGFQTYKSKWMVLNLATILSWS